MTMYRIDRFDGTDCEEPAAVSPDGRVIGKLVEVEPTDRICERHATWDVMGEAKCWDNTPDRCWDGLGDGPCEWVDVVRVPKEDDG